MRKFEAMEGEDDGRRSKGKGWKKRNITEGCREFDQLFCRSIIAVKLHGKIIFLFSKITRQYIVGFDFKYSLKTINVLMKNVSTISKRHGDDRYFRRRRSGEKSAGTTDNAATEVQTTPQKGTALPHEDDKKK